MRCGQVVGADGSTLFARSSRTETRWERMRGLLGRDAIETDESLWIDRCDSVHTFAMRFPIDLAYLDGKGLIRKTVEGLAPGRMSVCFRSSATLEMKVGSVARLGLRAGDRIAFRASARQGAA